MANLAVVVDTLEKIPVELRTYYELKDGKYALSLEGTPVGFASAVDLSTANARVVEFRDKNINLLREVEELRPLKTKFEGLDPEAARAALESVKKLKNKGVGSEDDLAAMIKSALEVATKPLVDKVAQLTTTNEANAKRADDAVMDSFIAAQFVKAGGKPSASGYITSKAREAFEVKDGKVVAKTGKFSGDKPGDPLGIDEWLAATAKTDDFAFGKTAGSDAPPASGTTNSLFTGRIVRDPTPTQLGELAHEIRLGKVRVEMTQP